jgi:hypothetical protein
MECNETQMEFYSRGREQPSAKGTFGLPAPSSVSWYWGGFLYVQVNGKEGTVLASSADLFWKLRALAVLNSSR